jgi:hypothetical protein
VFLFLSLQPDHGVDNFLTAGGFICSRASLFAMRRRCYGNVSLMLLLNG